MPEVDGSGPVQVARLRNSVRVELLKDASQAERARFKVEHLVKEVLQGVMKQQTTSVLCLQDFAHAGFMDITFGEMTSCLDFVATWERNLQHPALRGLKVRALYIWEDVPVTVHMYNPFVEESDIRHFLQRYCLKVEGGQKICNAFGIWNGRRKYLVRFRPEPTAPGGVVQPPGSFAIGPHRGFLFYPGQPVTCRKCGTAGHTKSVCNNSKCRFCGSQEHESTECRAPKKCSLCGGEDHLYRSCALRRKTFADLFSQEDMQGGGGKSPGVETRKLSPEAEEHAELLEVEKEGGQRFPSFQVGPTEPCGESQAERVESHLGQNSDQEKGQEKRKQKRRAKEWDDGKEGDGQKMESGGGSPPVAAGVWAQNVCHGAALKDWSLAESGSCGDSDEQIDWANCTVEETADSPDGTKGAAKRPFPREDEDAELERRFRFQETQPNNNVEDMGNPELPTDKEEQEQHPMEADPSPSALPFLGWEEERYKMTTGMRGAGRGRGPPLARDRM